MKKTTIYIYPYYVYFSLYAMFLNIIIKSQYSCITILFESVNTHITSTSRYKKVNTYLHTSHSICDACKIVCIHFKGFSSTKCFFYTTRTYSPFTHTHPTYTHTFPHTLADTSRTNNVYLHNLGKRHSPQLVKCTLFTLIY